MSSPACIIFMTDGSGFQILVEPNYPIMSCTHISYVIYLMYLNAKEQLCKDLEAQ